MAPNKNSRESISQNRIPITNIVKSYKSVRKQYRRPLRADRKVQILPLISYQSQREMNSPSARYFKLSERLRKAVLRNIRVTFVTLALTYKTDQFRSISDLLKLTRA